jgi:uridine kinase
MRSTGRPNAAIVLIDGVFLLRPELDDLWDVRIFVEIDPEDSLRRGPPRDQAWVGSVEAAIPPYHQRYIPGEDHYIGLIRPAERADIIVDNRDPVWPRLRFRPA